MLGNRKPEFSINTELTQQRGYFYSPAEVSAEFRELKCSIGKVLDHGRDSGSCFVAKIGSQKYLISAIHCFLQFLAPYLGKRRIVFPGAQSIDFDPDVLSSEEVVDEFEIRENDLLIINARKLGIDVKPLQVSADPILQMANSNSRAILMGYPDEYLRRECLYDPVISTGVITNWAAKADWLESDATFIETNARTANGMSGGPLLIDGKVVGVASQWRIRSKRVIDDDREEAIIKNPKISGVKRFLSTFAYTAPISLAFPYLRD